MFLRWVAGEESLVLDQLFDSPRPVVLTEGGKPVSIARRNKAGKRIEESLKWKS